MNSTILKSLRFYCENQEQWNEFLPSIMDAYRATPSFYSTQFSPFKMLLGKDMTLPQDVEVQQRSPSKIRSVEEYMEKLIPKIELMRNIARKNRESRTIQSNVRQDSERTRLWSWRQSVATFAESGATPESHN